MASTTLRWSDTSHQIPLDSSIPVPREHLCFAFFREQRLIKTKLFRRRSELKRGIERDHESFSLYDGSALSLPDAAIGISVADRSRPAGIRCRVGSDCDAPRPIAFRTGHRSGWVCRPVLESVSDHWYLRSLINRLKRTNWECERGGTGQDAQLHWERGWPHHRPQRFGDRHTDPASFLETMCREVARHGNVIDAAGLKRRRILVTVSVSQVQ